MFWAINHCCVVLLWFCEKKPSKILAQAFKYILHPEISNSEGILVRRPNCVKSKDFSKNPKLQGGKALASSMPILISNFCLTELCILFLIWKFSCASCLQKYETISHLIDCLMMNAMSVLHIEVIIIKHDDMLVKQSWKQHGWVIHKIVSYTYETWMSYIVDYFRQGIYFSHIIKWNSRKILFITYSSFI